MTKNPRRFMGILMAGAFVELAVLWPLFEAADQSVRVAGAITGIVVLVLSYVLLIVTMIRLAREGADPEVKKARLQRLAPWHMAIMLGAPIFIGAAHPWGMATIAVAAGAFAACQVLFLHGQIVVGLLFRRRARGAQAT